ncbi:Periplasmic/secreted acid trehalase ATH1 [Cladobotryum mycophilum]|uniref:alpha,alpha-trehalase n=1 Tax=Cladobotryum mycophilum TaxID=491253 RepID=A0ABR0S941_9HYPO
MAMKPDAVSITQTLRGETRYNGQRLYRLWGSFLALLALLLSCVELSEQRVMWRPTAVSLFSAFTAIICHAKLQNIASPSGGDGASWVLTTESFTPNRYQSAPYVSNGYFGQTLPAEGTGYWIERLPDGSPALNGWPLDQNRATFGTITGFWNLQDRVTHPTLPESLLRPGESVISGIPDWTGLVVTTNAGESYQPGVNSEQISRYSQSQSINDGIVHTNVTWQPKLSAHPLQLNFTVLAHHQRLTLGLVRLDITTTVPINFTITDVLDGAGATRANFGDKNFLDDEGLIWTSVKPWGVENTTAYVASRVKFSGLSSHEAASVEKSRKDATNNAHVVSQNMSSMAQSWNIDLSSHGERTITIIKYAGIASTDAFPRRAYTTAIKTVTEASTTSWDKLMAEHHSSWSDIWNDADIIIPGDGELQRTTRAALFHLLTNTVTADSPSGMTENSIPVGGLSSDSYAGLVFWDSDLWMYPPLMALHPSRARPILDYRQRLLGQAEDNAREWGRPGALYPWTSGRYGNCTGTGLCVWYQYHLNTDIALSHWNHYLYNGDKNWLQTKAWPLIKSVADMFAAYVVLNGTTGQYDTILLGEPDEFAYSINNGAYTNAGIKVLLGEWAPAVARLIGAGDVPANWSTISDKIKIPYDKDAEIIIEYDGMDPEVKIKQADVALISYPLGWRISEQQSLNDMAFYARATTANGPAMTWAIHAVNALQLHPTGCAGYTYLLQSYQPYLRGPYYQFSEQQTDSWSWAEAAGTGKAATELDDFFGDTNHTNAAFPFLTGYGGYLQIFTHGFTGMRAELDQTTDQAVLVVDPVMVPQLPQGLQVKGIKFQGTVLDFDIGLTETIISRRSSGSPEARNAPITIRMGSKAAKTGDFVLRPAEQIVVATRRADLNGTAVPGNLAQCASVRPALSASSTQVEAWVAGRHPVAAVDGSADTAWQPLLPDHEASIIIDLGESKRVDGLLVNWAASPALRFSLEGQSEDGSEDWNDMFKADSVEISAPYDSEAVKRIALPGSNVTRVTFDQPWDVKRFRFTVFGTQGNDQKVGATVAEIAIIRHTE